MSRVQSLILRTRRFRLTLAALLLLFAIWPLTSQSQQTDTESADVAVTSDSGGAATDAGTTAVDSGTLETAPEPAVEEAVAPAEDANAIPVAAPEAPDEPSSFAPWNMSMLLRIVLMLLSLALLAYGALRIRGRTYLAYFGLGLTYFFMGEGLIGGPLETGLDWATFIILNGYAIGLALMLDYYERRLWHTSVLRDLILVFCTKVTEYSAYGAANMAFVLYLATDCGLSRQWAGNYIMFFSMLLTVLAMIVGAVCDAIGVKKTLLIGCISLLIGRFLMPFVDDWVLATFMGFVPTAIGIAITGPVLSVAIKHFTTRESAALGFGLFYTLMNVGWMIGAAIFDSVRGVMGDVAVGVTDRLTTLGEVANSFSIGDATAAATTKQIELLSKSGSFINSGEMSMPILGVDMSTYQVIIFLGFFITIPDLIFILLMRDGAKMTEHGPVVPSKAEKQAVKAEVKAARDAGEAGEQPIKIHWIWFVLMGGLPLIPRFLIPIKSWNTLVTTFKERPFWVFMFMLSILVFVRVTFYHFHYTFPPYAIKIFGEGSPVGNIFGVLNPGLIVFMVPLFALLTRKVPSYQMLFVGAFISAASAFIAVMPVESFAPLCDTAFGDLVYDRWLGLEGPRDPYYMELVVFIFVFTVGEAIWSPRLMQFTAEIAPPGKEGTYIALSYLPFFLSKFIVGPMSGFLVDRYTPDLTSAEIGNIANTGVEQYFNHWMYPGHQAVWVWIGGMALLSPLGLLLFRKLYKDAQDKASLAAESAGAALSESIEDSEAPSEA